MATSTQIKRTRDPNYKPASTSLCRDQRRDCMMRARYWKARGMLSEMRYSVRLAWRWHYLAMKR